MTLSLERRKQLVALADQYGVPIIEHDPYGELVFEGEPIPSIKSLDTKGRVIYIGTFSKVLAPGFRLAWVIASEEIINKFALTKQSSDLCSNMFVQYIAYEYINGGYLDKQIQNIKQLYRHKRDVTIKALEEYFPESAKWTIPGGGMSCG